MVNTTTIACHFDYTEVSGNAVHTDRRFHSESTLQDIRIVEISTILMCRELTT
jgi:hypothetical protein